MRNEPLKQIPVEGSFTYLYSPLESSRAVNSVTLGIIATEKGNLTGVLRHLWVVVHGHIGLKYTVRVVPSAHFQNNPPLSVLAGKRSHFIYQVTKYNVGCSKDMLPKVTRFGMKLTQI